jgi:hypothetical protein
MNRSLRLLGASATFAAMPPGITAFADRDAQRQYVVFVDQCGDLDLLSSSGPSSVWTQSRLFPAGVYAPGSPLVSTYQPRERTSQVQFLAGDAEPHPGDWVDAFAAPPATLVDITAATARESPVSVRRHFEACGRELDGFALRDDESSPTLEYVLPTAHHTPIAFYVGADRGIYVVFGGDAMRLTQAGQTLPSNHRLQGGANVLAGYYDLFDDSVVVYYVGDDGFVYAYHRPIRATSWTWEVVGGGTAAH